MKKKLFGYVMAGALGVNILGAASTTFAASNDIHNTASKTQVETSVSHQVSSKQNSELKKLQSQAKGFSIKIEGKTVDQLKKEINDCKDLQSQAKKLGIKPDGKNPDQLKKEINKGKDLQSQAKKL
ncbi:hypothetical protein P4597_27090, partial [Peribacillus simplex]|nr:hypothetical protein [Peribacillus simplex]